MSKRRIGYIKEVRRSTQKLSLEWRIPKFLSLPHEEGESCKSEQFSFWDGCWNLCVWPNFYGFMEPGLRREDSGTSCKRVNVTFGVKGSCDVEMTKEEEYEFSNDHIMDIDQFCHRSNLFEHKERLMPGDALTLTCEIKIAITFRDVATETDDDLREVCVDRKQFSEKQAIEQLQNYLQRLLENEEDCDVVIKVQGKEFRAHRLILRARSPVFQAMFSHDMLEKQSGVVNMEDCDPESFPALLEHMYTGSTGMISAKNVFSLFASSDKYDLILLKKECSQFIKNNMTVSSFCTATALAVRHNEKELIDCATEFFCNNTVDIIKTAEWQTFLKENLTVGNELFIKFATK